MSCSTDSNYTDLFPFECRVVCNICKYKQFKYSNCKKCGKSFKFGVPDKVVLTSPKRIDNGKS